MEQLMGVGASAGCALGNAVLYTPRRQLVERSENVDVQAELARFSAVRRLYNSDLMVLYTQTLAEVGREAAEIFAMYREITEDPMLVEGVEMRVRSENVNLEYALYYEGHELHHLFGALDDPYMRERGTDILNVCDELILRLRGRADIGHAALSHREVIVVAQSLDPATVVSLDKSVVRGIVTEKGSVFSHAAILARARGIPTVVCVEGLFQRVKAGETLALNGTSGEIIAQPDAHALEYYETAISAMSRRKQYSEAAAQRAVTLDGLEMRVTVELIQYPDLTIGDWRTFDGVGMFRTEFVFLSRDTLPSEETQFQTYCSAVERAHGRPVVISVADIGGDWRGDYMEWQDNAENPSLGRRGVRYLLHAREQLRTQLRAILRASAFGYVKLLLPMLARLEELHIVRETMSGVMRELRDEGIPFDPDIPVGILVETPAAVSMIDSFVRECDFISIGSTDLAQYLLAVDHTNPSVSQLCDPYDTAVLRSIAYVARAARQAGLPVGICGVAAYESALLPLWAALGIGELTVPLPFVAKLRAQVHQVSARPLRAAMDDIMSSENPRETRKLIAVRSARAVHPA